MSGHSGTVRVTYHVFGDRVDGTYLAIDSTHAHINMPAALMWARGLELRARDRALRAAGWLLVAGRDAAVAGRGRVRRSRAPNLQYLMDSPTELSGFGLRTFQVTNAPGNPLFRLAVHHTGDRRGT